MGKKIKPVAFAKDLVWIYDCMAHGITIKTPNETTLALRKCFDCLFIVYCRENESQPVPFNRSRYCGP